MDALGPVRKVNSMVPIETQVCNQKGEGICGAMAIADMVTIVLRMSGIEGDDFDLSPQVVIDARTDFHDTVALCREAQEGDGLEKLSNYPFTRLGRNIKEWSEKCFQSKYSDRYRLEDIMYFESASDIKHHLISNFAEDGRRYPCVGIAHMSPRFEDETVARGFFSSTIPYRHLPGEKLSAAEHSLMIVGMNTMSDNILEHYCVVKNTHGEKWGHHGYSRAGVEVFKEIIVPTQRTRAEIEAGAIVGN